MIHAYPDQLEPARRIAAARGETIGLDRIETGPAALDTLPEVVAGVAGSSRIVILEDATPMTFADRDLKQDVLELASVAGHASRVVLGSPDGSLHVDPAAIAAAAAAADGAGCVVSVGSGTVTDIAKEAARIAGVPLVAVQSAASVNGFADGMAVVLRDGVKRTVSSVWPRALIIDTRVLAGAPVRLTRAGFAEMMAMFTAPADWRLAAAAGQDGAYDGTAVDLYRSLGNELLAAAPGIRHGDADGLGLLAHLLTSSGLAMGAVSRTAPMSGSEHLISHLLDMSAAADCRPVGLHGAQVGVAALVASCVWERLGEELDPDELTRPAPDPAEMVIEVEDAFAPLDPGGAMGRECWSDYARKLDRWDDAARAALAARWSDVAADIGELVIRPGDLATALSEIGAPVRFEELDPAIERERARWAVASSHLMRDRFTVVDLAFLTGHWTPADVDAVLARLADLGVAS